MLRTATFIFLAALAWPAQATLPGGDFMALLREAASVAPLRMRGQPETHVLPGHFDGRRADAVVITDGTASLCKGPDYKRCLPIGQLPTARTVAVDMANGKSVLLQFDSLSLGQVCTVDAHGGRAGLDCRALDFNRLADYKAQLIDGQLLAIDGVDGKYFCTVAKRGPQCARINNADGSALDGRVLRQQRRHGLTFTPADQKGKTCRLKRGSGEIDCGERVSMRDPFMALGMVPVGLFYLEDEEGNDEVFDGMVMDTVYVTGQYSPSTMEGGTFWWQFAPLAPTPRSQYEICTDDCNERDRTMGNACRVGAGIGLLCGPRCAVMAGTIIFLTCEAVRAIMDTDCRNQCVY